MASISGRVLDVDGYPVAEATVLITESSEPHVDIAQVTDPDGRFSLRDLAPGDYRIEAHLPGGERAEIHVGLTYESDEVSHDLRA
ncbi:MAG: carboxypeptidase regulatory-like domain-containing protein [Acidimicrobiia bacterium]|nr:carboxypeptidase regulatory-like domain-containing protein [Acidimicrobiia bacterium]